MIIDVIADVLRYISHVLNIANPFLFGGATCLWIRLYLTVSDRMSRNYMRQYCLEQQIDFIVNNREIDKEYINHLREVYRSYEDKKSVKI